MKEEPLCITNPSTRIRNNNIYKELKTYEQYKMRLAEQREIELLNKKTLLDDIISLFMLVTKHRKQKSR